MQCFVDGGRNQAVVVDDSLPLVGVVVQCDQPVGDEFRLVSDPAADSRLANISTSCGVSERSAARVGIVKGRPQHDADQVVARIGTACLDEVADVGADFPVRLDRGRRHGDLAFVAGEEFFPQDAQRFTICCGTPSRSPMTSVGTEKANASIASTVVPGRNWPS